MFLDVAVAEGRTEQRDFFTLKDLARPKFKELFALEPGSIG